MPAMELGWSRRRTAESAELTKRGVLLTPAGPSWKTPLAAHANMRRSTSLARAPADGPLPILAAISAADSGPSASASAILNFCASWTSVVEWKPIARSSILIGGGVSASAPARSAPARTLSAMKAGHGGGADQSLSSAASSCGRLRKYTAPSAASAAR